jgi:thioredoxin 1
MNPSFLLTAVVLFTLPSCEKIRSFTGKSGGKPSAAAAPAAASGSEWVSEITGSEYDGFSRTTGRLVVVDFYADWCGPCRQLGPILHDIATEKQGMVLVGKVNVDKATALAAKEGVNGIPDVRIFRDGKQVDRFVGLPGAAEVRRKIESHLNGLAPPAAKDASTEPRKTDAPLTQPMSKDWIPPGMQRR